MKSVVSKKVGLGIKRFVDISVSGSLLVLLLPVSLVVSEMIRRELGPPVIFEQQRPGLKGQPFVLRKFRTMRAETVDENGYPLGDAARTPPLGYRLRRLSLDEIPQLVNVLRGDMSLVGPRPLLMRYLDKYTVEQQRRHDMRPGITGWAQVNGRQNLRFSERFALDVWYVDNWSLGLDAKIGFLTVASVFSRRGVITGQDVTDVDDVGFNEQVNLGKVDSRVHSS